MLGTCSQWLSMLRRAGRPWLAKTTLVPSPTYLGTRQYFTGRVNPRGSGQVGSGYKVTRPDPCAFENLQARTDPT